MTSAISSAARAGPTALILVNALATETQNVALAHSYAMSAAATEGATSFVTSLAYHVQRTNAPQAAHTASALCPVLPYATGFPARDGAPCCWSVVTSALLCVARPAPSPSIARSVEQTISSSQL